MLNKLKSKIEQNRNSKKVTHRFLVYLKDSLWNIYSSLKCSFSKIFLHPTWQFTKKTNLKIRPVILTCEKDLITTKRFINSFKRIMHTIEKPIIFVDTFTNQTINTEYENLLKELNPEKIIKIKKLKLKISRSQNIELFTISKLFSQSFPYITDAMLFLEDDIRFSSKFEAIIKRLNFKKSTGFITLYSPYGEYSGKTRKNLYEINPKDFYGSQAILFPKKIIKLLKENSEKLKSFPAGYDHQWCDFLANEKYKILATNNSYVQHLGESSRIGSKEFHYSKKFIK